jgi:hypothetical protein
MEKFKRKEIDIKLITSTTMLMDSLMKVSLLFSIRKLQQNMCLSVLSSSNKEGC